MRKELVILTIFLLALTACSSAKVIVPEEQQTAPQTEAKPVVTTNITLEPEFKLVKQNAVRNPPTVSGTVLNKGLVDGSVKVIAKVYYASVVAEEESQVITVKAGKEANFSMSFDKVTQWISYSVVLE